jgi:hypothetical protein
LFKIKFLTRSPLPPYASDVQSKVVEHLISRGVLSITKHACSKTYFSEEGCRTGSKTYFHFNIQISPFKCTGLESFVALNFCIALARTTQAMLEGHFSLHFVGLV